MVTLTVIHEYASWPLRSPLILAGCCYAITSWRRHYHVAAGCHAVIIAVTLRHTHYWSLRRLHSLPPLISLLYWIVWLQPCYTGSLITPAFHRLLVQSAEGQFRIGATEGSPVAFVITLVVVIFFSLFDFNINITLEVGYHAITVVVAMFGDMVAITATTSLLRFITFVRLVSNIGEGHYVSCRHVHIHWHCCFIINDTLVNITIDITFVLLNMLLLLLRHATPEYYIAEHWVIYEMSCRCCHWYYDIYYWFSGATHLTMTHTPGLLSFVCSLATPSSHYRLSSSPAIFFIMSLAIFTLHYTSLRRRAINYHFQVTFIIYSYIGIISLPLELLLRHYYATFPP